MGRGVSWADVVVHPCRLFLPCMPVARCATYASPTAALVQRDRRRTAGLHGERSTLSPACRHSHGRRQQLRTDSRPTRGRYDIQPDDPRHSERADSSMHGPGRFAACAETNVSDDPPCLLGDASRDQLRRRQPSHRVGRPGIRVPVDLVYLPESRGAAVQIGGGSWSDDHAHPTVLARRLLVRLGQFPTVSLFWGRTRGAQYSFPWSCHKIALK